MSRLERGLESKLCESHSLQCDCLYSSCSLNNFYFLLLDIHRLSRHQFWCDAIKFLMSQHTNQQNKYCCSYFTQTQLQSARNQPACVTQKNFLFKSSHSFIYRVVHCSRVTKGYWVSVLVPDPPKINTQPFLGRLHRPLCASKAGGSQKVRTQKKQ